jgi:hypothetical protein
MHANMQTCNRIREVSVNYFLLERTIFDACNAGCELMAHAQKRKLEEARKSLFADASINDLCADLLRDDDDILAIDRFIKCKQLPIESDSEKNCSEETVSQWLLASRTRIYPPALLLVNSLTAFQSCQDLISQIPPPKFRELFNPLCKGALKAYFTQDSFYGWHSETRKPLPGEIFDAIYAVTLQSDEGYLDLACLAHNTLISLITKTVRKGTYERSMLTAR